MFLLLTEMPVLRSIKQRLSDRARFDLNQTAAEKHSLEVANV